MKRKNLLELVVLLAVTALSLMSLTSALEINLNSPSNLNLTSDNYYDSDSIAFNVTLSGASGDSMILADIDRTLAAWYRFDSTSAKANIFIKDWSSYGNDVANNVNKKNNPQYSSEGKFGESIYFDGKKDGLNLKDSLVPKEGPFTISLWFNADDSKKNQEILTQSTKNKGDFFIRYTKDSTILLKFDSGKNGKIESGKYNSGEWHNVVVVYDGNEIKLYVNGVLEGTEEFDGKVSQRFNTMIGKMKGDSSSFKGYIDDVQIYSRALEEGEIKALNGLSWGYNHSFLDILGKEKFSITFYGQNLSGDFEGRKIVFVNSVPYVIKEISSCGTLDMPNTYYVLSRDIISKGTCFIINADNVTLDGQGKEIQYAKKTSGFGVIAFDNNNILVKNLILKTENDNSHAIFYNGTTNSLLERNTIKTGGRFSIGILISQKAGYYPLTLFLNNTVRFNHISVSGLDAEGLRVGGFNHIVGNHVITYHLQTKGLMVASSFNNITQNYINQTLYSQAMIGVSVQIFGENNTVYENIFVGNYDIDRGNLNFIFNNSFIGSSYS